MESVPGLFSYPCREHWNTFAMPPLNSSPMKDLNNQGIALDPMDVPLQTSSYTGLHFSPQQEPHLFDNFPFMTQLPKAPHQFQQFLMNNIEQSTGTEEKLHELMGLIEVVPLPECRSQSQSHHHHNQHDHHQGEEANGIGHYCTMQTGYQPQAWPHNFCPTKDTLDTGWNDPENTSNTSSPDFNVHDLLGLNEEAPLPDINSESQRHHLHHHRDHHQIERGNGIGEDRYCTNQSRCQPQAWPPNPYPADDTLGSRCNDPRNADKMSSPGFNVHDLLGLNEGVPLPDCSSQRQRHHPHGHHQSEQGSEIGEGRYYTKQSGCQPRAWSQNSCSADVTLSAKNTSSPAFNVYDLLGSKEEVPLSACSSQSHRHQHRHHQREEGNGIGEGHYYTVQSACQPQEPQVAQQDVVIIGGVISAPAHGNKKRMKWTPELHNHFLRSVSQLGGADEATPSGILRIMDVEGLTIDHVKSHLQKYRRNHEEGEVVMKSFMKLSDLH